MRFFFLISIFFFLGTTFPGISCQEDGFYNFLFNAAEAFPSWMAQNRLDPTPEMPEELSLEYSQGFVNLTSGKIWNQVMLGHSRWDAHPDPDIRVNLVQGHFFVRIFLSYFNLTAEYEVEGAVASAIPITGAGKIRAWPSTPTERFVELRVDGFELTPDGYIDISVGLVQTWTYFELGRFSIEGLSAGGYEAEIEGILKGVYQRKLNEDDFSMFPIPHYFRLYLEELFAKTPISEIIDTTLPPPSTDPTEPPGPGTEDPCRSSVFGGVGSTLLEEKVLKKIVTVKENGEKVEIVEKLVKFERKLKD